MMELRAEVSVHKRHDVAALFGHEDDVRGVGEHFPEHRPNLVGAERVVELGEERRHGLGVAFPCPADHASSASRSSTVSRLRITVASPPATSTAAGRGTPL